MKVLLETDRLILRQFVEADEDHLFELDSDPEVVRFFPGYVADRKQIRELLQANFQYYQDYEGYGFWAVLEKPNQTFLGWFLMRPWKWASYFAENMAAPDDLEIGYRFHKAAWGKGYATEGTRALIAKGFNELNAQNVMANASPNNKASIRVMEKAGMHYQTCVFNETLGEETVTYNLNRDDFLKMKNSF